MPATKRTQVEKMVLLLLYSDAVWNLILPHILYKLSICGIFMGEKIEQILYTLEHRRSVQSVYTTNKRADRKLDLRLGGEKYKGQMKNIMQPTLFIAFSAFAIAGIVALLHSSMTVSNSVGGRELPIYCVETDKPQVAISFDAAWGNEDTKILLDILRKNNVQATFFMTGGWVESYPEDVRAILADGHDLGNHSEHHKNMSQISSEECLEEVNSVHEKVRELTGYEMFLFRPPYGDYDNKVMKSVESCGYYGIQWSIDSLDWKDYGAKDIVKRVVESDKLKNGAIVLMHNGAKYTPEALADVIKGIRDKGYEIVPISELIYRDHYHMLADGTQVKN